jgi:hypothetical protein
MCGTNVRARCRASYGGWAMASGPGVSVKSSRCSGSDDAEALARGAGVRYGWPNARSAGEYKPKGSGK